MILNKPYEKQAYLDFIAYCNTNGCTIKDNGDYLESLKTAYTPTVEEQIEDLKLELASYDYIGVKIAMGVATKEDYAEKIAYTQQLRAKINALQANN